MRGFNFGPLCKIMGLGKKDLRFKLRRFLIGKKVQIVDPFDSGKIDEHTGWVENIEVFIEDPIAVEHKGRKLIIIQLGEKVHFRRVRLKLIS